MLGRAEAASTDVIPPEPGPEVLAHAPDAGSIDLHTIRRSWSLVLERLGDRRQMILRAHLEAVTASAFDGETLELAFPPGRKFAVQKVQVEGGGSPGRVRGALRLDAAASCASAGLDRRRGRGRGRRAAALEEDAVARLQEALGAQVEEVAEIPDVAT